MILCLGLFFNIIQRQPRKVFWIFCSIHMKTPVLESLFDKVTGLQDGHLRMAASDHSSDFMVFFFNLDYHLLKPMRHVKGMDIEAI